MIASKLVEWRSGAWAFGVSGMVILSTACSPSSFFGGPAPTPVQDYRRTNAACTMQLDKPTMDIVTFRKMVACFSGDTPNSPFKQLVDQLSDADVQPLLDLTNNQLLGQPNRLYALQKTYMSLRDLGVVKSTLHQLGRVLRNSDFISSGIALLKDSVVRAEPGRPAHIEPRLLKALELVSSKVTTPNIETAMNGGLSVARSRVWPALQLRFRDDVSGGTTARELSQEMVALLRENGTSGRELLTEMADGHFLGALDVLVGTDEAGVRAKSARLSLPLRYLSRNHAELFQGTSSLFSALDAPIRCMRGTQQVPNGVRFALRELVEHSTPGQAASFLQRSNVLQLVFLNPFCDYPSALNEHYPAFMRLASTPAIEPMTEMLRTFYGIRDGVQPDGEPRRPLIDWLIGFLGNRGPDGNGGTKHLIPLLTELELRGAWDDAILLAAIADPANNADFRAIFQFLIENHENLGVVAGSPQSVYDVLVDIASRTSPERLERFLVSSKAFVQDPAPILEPLLTLGRQAHFVNDAELVAPMLRDVLGSATAQEPILMTLFKISEMPEFTRTLALVGQMADQNDGRLADLVRDVVALYTGIAEQGRTIQVHATEAPAWVASRRHNLEASDLTYPPLTAPVTSANSDCARLSFNLSMADYSNPGFNRQLDLFLSCLTVSQSNPQYAGLVRSAEFLRNTCTGGSVIPAASLSRWIGACPAGEQPMLHFIIDMTRALANSDGGLGRNPYSPGWLNQFELQDLVRRLKAQIEHSPTDKAHRWLKLLDLAVTEPISGPDQLEAGPLLKPLMKLAGPLLTDPVSLNRVSAVGAKALQKPEIPDALKLVEKAWDTDLPLPQMSSQAYPLEKIRIWVHNRECRHLPGNARYPAYEEYRLRQIIGDYEDAVSVWDRDPTNPLMARRRWTTEEFNRGRPFADGRPTTFDGFQPLAVTLSNPEEYTVPNKSIGQAFINLMKRFTLEPNERPSQGKLYTPDHLVDWLVSRSNDYKLISFFYPGETLPKVRLVNSLDRLELVLLGVDFIAKLGPIKIEDNKSYYYLAQIGDAWGDEPYEVWPPEIQAQFPRTGSRRPKRIRDVYNEILSDLDSFENILGYPAAPDCAQLPIPGASPFDGPRPRPLGTGSTSNLAYVKEGLYNSRQVISVVAENLPDARDAHGRLLPSAGGMKVLRDLFFELYSTTKPEHRSNKPEHLSHNNLSVIFRMVRLGVTRQTSRFVRRIETPADMATFRTFIQSMVAAAAAPETPRVITALFGQDRERIARDYPNSLIGKIMTEIFDLTDRGTVEERRLAQQLGFYGLALLGQMNRLETPPVGQPDLVEGSVAMLRQIFETHLPFLRENTSAVGEVIRSRRLSAMVRALYELGVTHEPSGPWLTQKAAVAKLMGQLGREDSDAGAAAVGLARAARSTAEGREAWRLTVDRIRGAMDAPAYVDNGSSELVRDVVHFLQETGEQNGAPAGQPPLQQSALKLRQFLAFRMDPRNAPSPHHAERDGDLMTLLSVVRGRPVETYQMLESFAELARNGDLYRFLELVDRSVSETSGVLPPIPMALH